MLYASLAAHDHLKCETKVGPLEWRAQLALMKER
jgi:hypothetical protein